MTGSTQTVISPKNSPVKAKKNLQDKSLISMNKGLSAEIWIEILKNFYLQDIGHMAQLNKWFYQLLSGVNYRYSHVNDITNLPRSQLHQALLKSNLNAQFTQGKLWQYLLQNCEKVALPEFFQVSKTTTFQEVYFNAKEIKITSTDYHRLKDLRKFFLEYEVKVLRGYSDKKASKRIATFEASHILSLNTFWIPSEELLYKDNNFPLATCEIVQSFTHRLSPYSKEYLFAKLLSEAQYIRDIFPEFYQIIIKPEIAWEEIVKLTCMAVPENCSRILRFFITCRRFEDTLYAFLAYSETKSIVENSNTSLYLFKCVSANISKWREGLTSFGLLAANSQDFLILKAILGRFDELRIDFDKTYDDIASKYHIQEEIKEINQFIEILNIDDFEYYLSSDTKGNNFFSNINKKKSEDFRKEVINRRVIHIDASRRLAEDFRKQSINSNINLVVTHRLEAILQFKAMIKLITELYLMKGKNFLRDNYDTFYEVIKGLKKHPQLLVDVILKKETLLDVLLIDTAQLLSEHFKSRTSVQYSQEELIEHLKNLKELREILKIEHWKQIQRCYYWRHVLSLQQAEIDKAPNDTDPVISSSQMITQMLGGSGVNPNPLQMLPQQPVQHKVVEIQAEAKSHSLSPAYIGYAALLLVGLLLLGTGIGGLVHLSFITTALIFITGKSLVSGLSIGSVVTGAILLMSTGLKLALDFCRPSVKKHEALNDAKLLPHFIEREGKDLDAEFLQQKAAYQQPVGQSFVNPMPVQPQPTIPLPALQSS